MGAALSHHFCFGKINSLGKVQSFLLYIMCFTLEMSLALFAIGVVNFLWLLKKDKGRIPTMVLDIMCMDFLQCLGHLSLVDKDQYGWINWWVSYGLMFHVYTQPIFISLEYRWIFGKLGKPSIQSIYSRLVIPLSCIIAFLQLLRMVSDGGVVLGTFDCTNQIFCGARAEVVPGSVHLFWQVPQLQRIGGFDYITPTMFSHFMFFFLIPWVLGEYVYSICMFVTGPVLSMLMAKYFTSGSNVPLNEVEAEAASMWCLLTIPFLFLKLLIVHFGAASAGSTPEPSKKKQKTK